MYRHKKVSVIFPVYNEEENVKHAIEDFFLQPSVDEVIAVDNNSEDRSSEEIKKTGAKYVLETTQGYGAALKRGFKEATGDLIVAVEPDGTFLGSDIEKLLIYSDDLEVVFGTRTSKSLIWSNANMRFFLRVGNWAVAKFLEYLFNGPSLTDVGCTYKLIHRKALEKILPTLTVDGSHFNVEFIIKSLRYGFRCVEIPVHYKERVGRSKFTGTSWGAFKVGLRMIFFILEERIKSIYAKNL